MSAETREKIMGLVSNMSHVVSMTKHSLNASCSYGLEMPPTPPCSDITCSPC